MKITKSMLKEGAAYITSHESARRYFDQYDALIEFAKNIETPNPVSVDILALAVYAWMPTILKTLKVGALGVLNETSIADLRAANIENGLSIFLSYTKAGPPINNSWVGTSKFMHFLNPKVFPIWDSKICWALKGTKSPNSCKLYCAYFDAVHDAIRNSEAELAEIREHLSLINVETSDVRLVEMCVFAYGEKEKLKSDT